MHDSTQPLPPRGGPRSRKRSPFIAVIASVLALGALSLGIASSAAAAGPGHDDVVEARQATRRFHSVAAVKHAGYSKFTDVNGITCINGRPSQGNMGIHYVNGDLVGNGTFDIDQPQAVLYERTPSGLRLTAVEYIVLASNWHDANPPALFGHSFMLIDAPNRFGLPPFYALHAWIWKHNPSGSYRPWNPDVHCPPVS